jgi:hypothetical protein
MKNTLTREEVVAVAGKPAARSAPPSAPLLPLSEMFLPKVLVPELLQLGLLQSWLQLVGFPSQYNHLLCPVSK